jgi:hypothetical protein
MEPQFDYEIEKKELDPDNVIGWLIVVAFVVVILLALIFIMGFFTIPIWPLITGQNC